MFTILKRPRGNIFSQPRTWHVSGEEASLKPVLTRRVLWLYIPTIAVLAYWTSYSEGVVSSTSFHSLSPPINIVFVLAFLSGLVVPLHRLLQKGIGWVRLLLFASLFLSLRWFGAFLLRVISDLFYHSQPLLPQGIPVVWIFFLTLLLYPLVKGKLEHCQPLSSQELIALYILLMVGTLVTSYAVAQFLIPTLVSPYYFKTPENRWEELFFRYIPPWFGIRNPQVVLAFWEGSAFGVAWRFWIRPLFLWSVFALVNIWVMLCISSLLRRSWLERERLTFPLVTLPLELVREEPGKILGPLFRSPLMWLGFLLPVILHIFNGGHIYFPSIPAIGMRHINVMQGLNYRPWSAVGSLDVTFYPLLVGISYLLSVEVSFSVGFFFLLRKFLPVLGAYFGWDDYISPGGRIFPYADQQATGAFIALVVASLYLARHSLKASLISAWKGEAIEEGEALSSRTAWLGLIGGLAFLWGWCLVAGLDPLPALIFFLLVFAWSIAISRIRAEAGMGGITGPMTPQEVMTMIAGTSGLGAQNLTILAHLRWMTTDLRALPCLMPSQLENFKMAEVKGLSPRSAAKGMLLACVIAMVIIYILYLPIIHRFGGVTMNGQRFRDVPVTPFRELASHLSTPRQPDPPAIFATLFGFCFTLFLSAMRLRFTEWPFHPVGYAVGFSRRTIEWMWFSTLLGGVCKWILLRFGGLRTYRRALPLFLGFILGEFSMGVFFALLGCLYPEMAGYQLYP